MCMSFLDFKGSLIPSLSEQWRDTRDNKDMSERASKASSSESHHKPFEFLFPVFWQLISVDNFNITS